MRGLAIVALLYQYGCPAEVARDNEGARRLLRKAGHGRLSMDKIKRAVESANNTYGAPMVEAERETLKQMAKEIEQLRRKVMHESQILKELSRQCSATGQLADTFGLITAVVLVAFAGDPSEYRCAAAYEKTLGLNLKERSSGKHKGMLKITKRGSPIARNYLYLAALRLIQTDPVVRAWYELRARPKQKRKAVVALMRKLSRAMWHMSRGSVFDSTKLFDVRRLELNKVDKKAA